ncbi:MAG: GIY-YIG nuclease family protein [Bacteroidales bacterium]|nr:GIY-YIG nuclease family protein [Bacteroidales bacterium]
MEYFVYILFSEKFDKLYIGHTNNIDRRIYEHNLGHEKSTRSGIPWKLVYSRAFASRSEAYNEEQRIKKRKSKKYLEKLINQV